ncbi:hypothetical protein [Bacillus sp. REN3]|uniref:hypothetical protein n=1 Tax=Bacillus sp. REN3 TaxID=2802440 RepID=UPI001AED5259|nr:hypothetical protein [Bacillus sp. REN3]
MEEISVISMLVTAVLALGCLFLVLAPIFQWNSLLTVKSHSNYAPSEKEVLLTTLNELEFEYKMEKLSTKDYIALKKQYEAQVAAVMKNEAEPEKAKIDEDLLAEVEREIQQAMQQHKEEKGGS